jgi:hypothetical protein
MELRKYVILFLRNKRKGKQLRKKQSSLKQKSQQLNQKNSSTDGISDVDSVLGKKQVTLLLRHKLQQMMTNMKVG